MIVLGMIGLDMHPAACLLRDGQLVALAEEERFIRWKGAHGQLPGFAAQYCLQAAEISIQEVDYIAFAWNMPRYRTFMPRFFAGQFLRNLGKQGEGNVSEVLDLLLRFQPKTVERKIRDTLRKVGIRGKLPPIEFVTHHLCHAASTFYASGFEEAAILVIDGSGEQQCSTIFHGKGLNIRQVESFDIPQSLGWFFAGLTDYLGFTPYRDEGKVMGLAPYGQHREEYVDKLRRVLRSQGDGTYRVDPGFLLLGKHEHGAHYSNRLVDLLGKARYRGEPLEARHRDIAWATQDALETAAIALARRALEKVGSRFLCTAGGVALNCKMNGRIRAALAPQQFFVQPLAYDAGTCLGAAMEVARRAGDDPRFDQKHTYFGPDYSNAQVEAALKNAAVDYETPAAPARVVAEAIAQGRIVGHFQGRSEMGPRALGNRSILAKATDPGMREHVNRRAKFRESWRPFCPSLLDRARAEFVQDASSAPFMIVAYDVKEEHREALNSVAHVDGSIRPQTVTPEQNPRFAEVIEEVERYTGFPVVLNTSFNVRGEPVVLSPYDALRTFYSSGIDLLSIGDFIVRKP